MPHGIVYWGALVRDMPVMIFIDNDAARFGLISGYSPVAASASLISVTWAIASQLSVAPWFARVPTVCNLADGPSRLRFTGMESWPGARQVEPAFLGAHGSAIWPAIARRLREETP